MRRRDKKYVVEEKQLRECWDFYLAQASNSSVVEVRRGDAVLARLIEF